MSKNAKKQIGTLFGFPVFFTEPPVPAADNQPVCPLCRVGCVYKPDEIECVHGHKFYWIQSPPWTDPSRRFYAAISSEYCLDYWLMSRWGMIGSGSNEEGVAVK